ncbi:MAG: nucleotidyltransferase family protein, partial [Thermodesulfovibrionales bacterium]|nr:nucleotidyltransferase family protein [Thermodesulfovibrionales bacterium]
MEARVSAVLLAAGSAKRIGQIKQLLPLGNVTVIRRCIDSIIASGIRDIVVVISSNGESIIKEIEHLPVKIAVNRMPESEMAESVRIGCRMIENTVTGILVYPSDHPLVSPNTMKELLQKHMEEPDRILIPYYNQRRGHPTLFPVILLSDLYAGLNLRDII